MEKYDYRKAIRDDIMAYLADNDIYLRKGGKIDYDDACNAMIVADRVTGNGSGSYTFNTWTAEEYICHNMDLLKKAIKEIGMDKEPDTLLDLYENPEQMDILIRCYLLGEELPACLEMHEQAYGEKKKTI